MASKSKQTKAPTVYAFVLYNGNITRGSTVVRISTTHPESEVDGNVVFDSFFEYYTDDVKGRYVKCQKTVDEIVEGLTEKLENIVYTKNKVFLCKSNVTDVVKVLKEVTGAKQCSTMGVYGNSEQGTDEKSVKEEEDEQVEEEEPKAKKVAPKKVAAKKTPTKEPEEDEQVEEDKPVKKVAVKSVAKPKVSKAKVETEDEEGEQEIEAKSVPKKPAGKTVKPTGKTSGKKIISELDADLEEDVVVQTKSKSQPRGGTKTQILISDNEEEAEN